MGLPFIWSTTRDVFNIDWVNGNWHLRIDRFQFSITTLWQNACSFVRTSVRVASNERWKGLVILCGKFVNPKMGWADFWKWIIVVVTSTNRARHVIGSLWNFVRFYIAFLIIISNDGLLFVVISGETALKYRLLEHHSDNYSQHVFEMPTFIVCNDFKFFFIFKPPVWK